jgi:hypothetical protein
MCGDRVVGTSVEQLCCIIEMREVVKGALVGVTAASTDTAVDAATDIAVDTAHNAPTDRLAEARWQKASARGS